MILQTPVTMHAARTALNQDPTLREWAETWLKNKERLSQPRCQMLSSISTGSTYGLSACMKALLKSSLPMCSVTRNINVGASLLWRASCLRWVSQGRLPILGKRLGACVCEHHSGLTSCT